MAFVTSSQIGVDLNNASATQLFTLNNQVTGSDGSVWQYALSTAVLVTGQLVFIQPQGTAVPLSTGNIAASTAGLNIAVAQFAVSSSQYAFFAKQGTNLYLLCSGTVPPTTQLAFSATSGALVTSLLAAVGNTAAGIYVTTSASTAGLSCAVGIVTFPRVAPATSTTPMS